MIGRQVRFLHQSCDGWQIDTKVMYNLSSGVFDSAAAKPAVALLQLISNHCVCLLVCFRSMCSGKKFGSAGSAI